MYDIVLYNFIIIQVITEWITGVWMNEWCFRPRFCTVKTIPGRRQPGQMKWILLWIMPLVQDQSLDLLTSSPARYHCATDNLSQISRYSRHRIMTTCRRIVWTVCSLDHDLLIHLLLTWCLLLKAKCIGESLDHMYQQSIIRYILILDYDCVCTIGRPILFRSTWYIHQHFNMSDIP